MALIKQLLVTIVVLVVAGFLFLRFEPEAAKALLASDIASSAPVRSAILFASPSAGEEAKVGATPSGSGRSRGATIVVTDQVGEGVTRTQMKAIGTGDAVRSVVVYPDNTTGILNEIAVQSDDQVAAGDVLVRLESESEQLAVARARIALDAADEKLVRYQRLAQSNATSAVEVNDVLRERDNAKLDLRTSEIALAKRAIRAPIDGRVGIINVDKGDLVTSQTVIATVDDRSKLKVIFYVPEGFVPLLSVGDALSAVSTARPGQTFEGRITAIDSRLDEASRTLRTEAAIDNAADELRPGMSFTVTLSLPGQKYMSVDPMSVFWQRTGPAVWRVEDGKSRKVAVRIIERTIDRMLVTSDELKIGNEVIVEGLQSVRDGGPVEVQRNENTPGTPLRTSQTETSGNKVDNDQTSDLPAKTPAGSRVPGIGEAKASELPLRVEPGVASRPAGKRDTP